MELLVVMIILLLTALIGRGFIETVLFIGKWMNKRKK